jgi:hypothetical protein
MDAERNTGFKWGDWNTTDKAGEWASLNAVPRGSPGFKAELEDVTEVRAELKDAIEPKFKTVAKAWTLKVLTRKKVKPGVSIQQLERNWSRFGFFLPAKAQEKYFRPSLNEQIADCHEKLTNAPTRSRRARVIAWHTTLAFLIALDSLRVAIYRRLADELNWIVCKLPKL